MKRLTTVALLVLLTTPALASALAGTRRRTWEARSRDSTCRASASKGASRSARRHFVFVPENSPHAAEPLRIDYESIRHLEFGQRASRRVPLVVAATAVLGPLGLMSLPAKSRAHYLTLTYAGEQGRTEVIVIELGKQVVRSTLAVVEARSGIPIEYQDEEARKWSR